MSDSFDAGRLLRKARALSGLSQRELAHRCATSQSVISRIEQGRTSPTVATLIRLLRATGLELHAKLTVLPTTDSHMLEDVDRILRLSPEQRLLEIRNISRFEAAVRHV